MKKAARDWTALSDEPCRQKATLAYHALCEVHGQAVVECANQRLLQVKAAREMEERTMASARAWQDIANKRTGGDSGGKGNAV